jgi:hypothetical protein
MDWEPEPIVTIAAVQSKRAEWVSKEEIQRRHTNGSCLRCGKREHMIAKCNLLSAQRSTVRTKKIRVVKVITEELTSESEDSDLSGKE